MNSPEEKRAVSWTTMLGMLGGRLIVISGFLIFLSFVLMQDGIAFYAFIAFSYIITIPYSLWMRNQDRMRRLAPLQFLVDLVFVSGLVYFSGGHGHDFLILLYPLIILSAGIILPIKQTLQITLLSIISYTLVVLLMSQDILVEYPLRGMSKELVDTSGSMALRILIFIFFGIASAYVSRRCDYINRREKQFRELTQLIFENVNTGLLLLDHEENILMANKKACTLLGQEEQDLRGNRLSAIHIKASEMKHGNPDLHGASDYFRRPDGSVFPVSLHNARLTLPADAVPNAGTLSGDQLNTCIVDFNDISRFLILQSQTRQLERTRAAAGMAAEMAHRVRTPLTAISCHVQLMQLNLKNEPEEREFRKEQNTLCGQVVLETTRLDKVIQNFLDYAEFSLSDIRELIQQDINRTPGTISRTKTQ